MTEEAKEELRQKELKKKKSLLEKKFLLKKLKKLDISFYNEEKYNEKIKEKLNENKKLKKTKKLLNYKNVVSDNNLKKLENSINYFENLYYHNTSSLEFNDTLYFINPEEKMSKYSADWFNVNETNLIEKLYWSKIMYNNILMDENIINNPSTLFVDIDEENWEKEDDYINSGEEKFESYTREEFEEFPPLGKRITKLYTTTFRFKDFIKNYNNNNLFMYESSFFYKYRLYLGCQKYVTNFRNSHYLLGCYFNVCIIDAKFLLFSFKSNLFLINKIIAKKHLSGFLIGETENDIVEKGVINILYYFEMGYYYGRWWNGFFKNYKIFKFHHSIVYRNYCFYKHRFPAYIFFISIPESDCSTSLYSLNAELRRLIIPSTMFFDTRNSSEFIINPVLCNTKSYYYFLFYIKIIICMFMRIMFLKKQSFMRKSMNENPNYKYYKKKWTPLRDLSKKDLTDLTTNFIDNLAKERNITLSEKIKYHFFYDNFVWLIIKKKKLDLIISKLKNAI